MQDEHEQLKNTFKTSWNC